VHAETDNWPVAELVVVMPVGQVVQVGAPAAAKVPVTQSEQAEDPATAELPGAQAAQPEALAVPGSATLPKKPEAQIVHAETDDWPVAELVVVMPVGHAVQLSAPAAAKVPAGHGAQLEPPKRPAAQLCAAARRGAPSASSASSASEAEGGMAPARRGG